MLGAHKADRYSYLSLLALLNRGNCAVVVKADLRNRIPLLPRGGEYLCRRRNSVRACNRCQIGHVECNQIVVGVERKRKPDVFAVFPDGCDQLRIVERKFGNVFRGQHLRYLAIEQTADIVGEQRYHERHIFFVIGGAVVIDKILSDGLCQRLVAVYQNERIEVYCRIREL